MPAPFSGMAGHLLGWRGGQPDAILQKKNGRQGLSRMPQDGFVALCASLQWSDWITAFHRMMASVALIVGAALMPPSAVAKTLGTELGVDCDAGQSLQEALDTPKFHAPITIYVKGECNDGPFTIRQHVRLIGSPTAQLSARSGGHHVVGFINGAFAEFANLTLYAAGRNVGIAVHNNSTAHINTAIVGDASGTAINVADGIFCRDRKQ